MTDKTQNMPANREKLLKGRMLAKQAMNDPIVPPEAQVKYKRAYSQATAALNLLDAAAAQLAARDE